MTALAGLEPAGHSAPSSTCLSAPGLQPGGHLSAGWPIALTCLFDGAHPPPCWRWVVSGAVWGAQATA